jgi:hypothetical protein
MARRIDPTGRVVAPAMRAALMARINPPLTLPRFHR